ncbi:hypothetical protein ACRJBZ_000221 [Vibrio fluvialis]|uniref:hypothetical protein n=1 Tax=Vibrio fluvialis TaxID=676 RepID=UPI0015599A1E|nr:hypothetical protein [Vibrio fluvialis]EKO3417837.1 hypothetical protein [Vibrio fluvialis]EKO3954287.1 hypothetical protein [Vibrio fluvialis]ELG4656390.1 hypothetical protein [Vibrio fluvialis]ELV8726454.1 hypothetical protein [Vibrio fluvialis]
MGNWNNIEKLVLASKDFILTEEERQLIVKEEQQAYVTNMPAIIEVLNMAELKLKALGFWVENNVTEQGTRFRFSLQGYYGPGGFSTLFHISGPLVLGLINPAGNELASFYPNDIDQCFLMGLDFDKTKFEQFVLKQIENYLQPENLITSKEQYDRFRALLSN